MGRLAYALAFMALLPAALVLWARALDRQIGLSIAPSGYAWAIAGAGGLVMALSMSSLIRRGGGLPMNAYPTRRRVGDGVYALVAHPIYTGFVAAVIGVSWALGSAAGFWVVAPACALGCAALVWGYERHATDARLGPGRAPLLSLPGEATGWARLGACLVVLGPWLALYEAVGHLPIPGAVDVRLLGEAAWPVRIWTEAVYISVYPIAVLAPWACRDAASLRSWAVTGIIGTWLGVLIYLAWPAASPPTPFEGDGFWAELLRLERADGLEGRAACPSFHVFWAVASASAFASRGGLWRSAWLWCGALAVSCITTGMHAVLDIPAGVALWVVARRAPLIARRVLDAAERVANAWREWRLGPLRIINHGLFAGAGAAAGVAIAAAVGGSATPRVIAVVSLSSLIGGALWGQAWVTAPTSLRPFGYYGAVLGAFAGLGALSAMGVLAWTQAGALAVAAPWVQAVGRLRCLIQGCCHGAPTRAEWGIRYHHPRSRVCRASGLCGVPVHATPVYSISGNIVMGLLLARLWRDGASPAFVVGAYMMLAGFLRFVEEHFRGEPHTPVWGGLRVYQWFAAASVAAGIGISSLAGTGWSAAGPAGVMETVWCAAVAGLAWFAGMGVDFPESTRRFSRLT